MTSKPDIMVISESENPEKLINFKEDIGFKSHIWDGDIAHKGLSIFTCNDYKATPTEFYTRDFKYIIPVHIKGSDSDFIFIGVWTKLIKSKALSYIAQACLAIEYYKGHINEQTIIAGDFNSNAQWDNLFNRKYNHAYLLKLLDSLGFVSVYHKVKGEEHGAETMPTHFYHRDEAKGFHIDYIFVHKSRKIKNFKIGDFKEWGELSDHVPMEFEIE